MSEITTTISELLITSRQIAESAQRVSKIAEDTADAARTGDATIDQTRASIAAIRSQVDQIVQHMLALGEKSQQIGGVVDLVSELAEQTNILAINATIEASGAGEWGRRFAVVAEEIRKLADRTAGSAKEIRALIEDVRGAVNTTVMATEIGAKAVDAGSRQFDDATSSFRRIAQLVATTNDATREIELSTKQQTTAVEQVNVAASDTARVTRETEASAVQTRQTAAHLSSLSGDLLELVGHRPPMSQDPLRYFRVEARELVDQISAGVLDLEQQPGPELVARLLRFAHTLKGAARVVRQQEIADRAHAFEEVLVPHRAGDAPLPADEMRELLRLNDEIEARVAALGTRRRPGAAAVRPPRRPSRQPDRAVRGWAGAGPGPAAGPRRGQPGRYGGPGRSADRRRQRQATGRRRTAEQPGPDPRPRRAAAAARARPATSTSCSTPSARRTPGSRRCAPARSPWTGCTAPPRPSPTSCGSGRTGRATPTPRAAAAVRLAGDLGALGRRLTDTVEQVERELDEVRGRAERLRLVAASSIFTALHRAVRDAADAQGKRVRLRGPRRRPADGPAGARPGQQRPAARRPQRRRARHRGTPRTAPRPANPPRARWSSQVERRGRYAAFRCTDDGRGFDLAAVRRTAEARGLLMPGRHRAGRADAGGPGAARRHQHLPHGDRGGRAGHRAGRGPRRRRPARRGRRRCAPRPGGAPPSSWSCRWRCCRCTG